MKSRNSHGELYRGDYRRRTFIKNLGATVALATSDVFASSSSRHTAPGFRPVQGPIVDVNLYLGSWPLRQIPGEEPENIVTRLISYGVTEAWTGTYDGLLHKDVGSANARLVESCRRKGRKILLPFGSINPTQPDWREELRRCAEVHRMRGIRLHPNYHGYTLDDPRFAELLSDAANRRLIVQLALIMEDERMMHPLARVAPVDTTPLAALGKTLPSLRLVLLNSLRTLRARPLLELIATDQVFVEIATLEGVGGLETLLGQVPSARVLFGSHTPYYYFESSLFKLSESELKSSQVQSICAGNARNLLASRI